MSDYKQLARLIVVLSLLWLPTGNVVAGQTPVSNITKGSANYKRIQDAIQILKDVGGDPTKKPSPAWMANNIQTYLNAGKIKDRNVAGAYGSNTTKGGPVYIHFNHINRQIVGGWDPKTEIGFKKLLILAQTLAHEKYHSENHGAWGRFSSTNEFESEAYLHEIAFIDEFALAQSRICNGIKNSEPGKKLACYKKMRIIYKSKQDLIRVYNPSKYARAGKPVSDVLVGVIDAVVEQMELVIRRWTEFAKAAGENTDSIGMLEQEFNQQYGQAQVAFHAQIETDEAQMLTTIAADSEGLSQSIGTQINLDVTSLYLETSRRLSLKTKPVAMLVMIDGHETLLTQRGIYSQVLLARDAGVELIRLSELDMTIDAVVRLHSSDVDAISQASDKKRVIIDLYEKGRISARLFDSKPDTKFYWLIGILVLLAILMLARRKN